MRYAGYYCFLEEISKHSNLATSDLICYNLTAWQLQFSELLINQINIHVSLTTTL